MYRRSLLLFGLLIFSLPGFSQTPSTWNSRGVGGGGALFAPSINPANDNEYYVGCDMSELFHTTDFGVTNAEVNFAQTQGGHNSKVQFTGTTGTMYSIDYASGAPGYVPIPVKTTDGGTTWSPLSGNPDPGEECYSINVDYNNPNRVIISYYGAVYFSSNGGTSFTNIKNAGNSGRGILVGGVFFDGNNIYIGTNDGLLISNNGGTSFTVSTVLGIPLTQAIFSFAGGKSGNTTRLLCLTGNATDIYVGKPGSDYSGFIKGVYTLDVGGNWTSKMTGINTSSDYMMFVGMAQNDINTLYLAGSKNSAPAVMKSTNAGGSWANVMNTSGNANTITGWQGTQGDRDWSYGECAFGFTVAPNNSNKLLIGDFGFVHKSSDGGTSWQQAYVSVADQHPAGANTPKGANYHSAGLENTTCWQVVWGDANTMVAGFSDIRGIRSTDSGNSWNFNYTGHSGNSLYRIGQHPNGNWYAGTSNIHDMYQSTRLQDAQLDANDANGKIIMSSNKGASWSDVKVFNHPVFWVALDPNNPERMYASVIHSSQGGIYITNNLSAGAGSGWTKLANPPRTQGHPASIVVLNDGKVVATYSGRRTTSFTNSSGCFLYDPGTSSWTDVSDPGMYYWTKDVVIDPADATQNTWYVGVFSGWGGAPNGLGGLYRTTNRGASWTKLTGSQFDRVTSITFNPINNNQAYLTTETQGLWFTNNISAPTPVWQLVSAYPFRQPERVFYNPYKPGEIWITSFGNGLKVGTISDTIFVCTTTNGSISPSGNTLVEHGDSAVFTFTPDPGYEIDSIVVDGASIGAPSDYTFHNVIANHTLCAYFKLIPVSQYTISASSGPNGSITPNGSVVVNSSGSQSFTFTPLAGYHIDSVLVDGLMTGTPASYDFTNVTANHTIHVVFAPNSPNSLTIIAGNGTGGIISPSGNISVPSGDSAYFTFIPDPGFGVDSVFVDDIYIGQLPDYTFHSVVSDHTIHITFARDTFSIVSVYDTSSGTISPSGQQFYAKGSSQQYSIVAQPGYSLDSLLIDGVLIPDTNSYTFSNISADHEIRAVFVSNPITHFITAGSGPNGTISPNGVVSVTHGDSIRFSITPDPGYVIDSVWIDSVTVTPTPDTTYTFYEVGQDHSIYVTFKNTSGINETKDRFNLSLSPIPMDENARLTFELKQPTKVTVSILNSNGQLLSVVADRKMESGLQTIQIDKSALRLTGGVYLIQLYDGSNQFVVKKLVVK